MVLAAIPFGLAIGIALGRLGGGGSVLAVPVTLAMTAAGVVGAVARTTLAGRVPQRQLGHGFPTMVAAVAAYLIISAAFLGGPPGS
jgi:hypothetical protein